MRRPRHLEHAHERLLEWSAWLIAHPHGITLLGVQSIDLARSGGRRPPGPLVPNDLMPMRIARVDQIIRDPDMPDAHRRTIARKYLMDKIESNSVSRTKHVKALEYVAGCLNAYRLTCAQNTAIKQ